MKRSSDSRLQIICIFVEAEILQETLERYGKAILLKGDNQTSSSEKACLV